MRWQFQLSSAQLAAKQSQSLPAFRKYLANKRTERASERAHETAQLWIDLLLLLLFFFRPRSYTKARATYLYQYQSKTRVWLAKLMTRQRLWGRRKEGRKKGRKTVGKKRRTVICGCGDHRRLLLTLVSLTARGVLLFCLRLTIEIVNRACLRGTVTVKQCVFASPPPWNELKCVCVWRKIYNGGEIVNYCIQKWVGNYTSI